MASLFRRGECVVLQFTGADNKRRTLSLPGATEKAAAKVLEHVEARISAAKFGLVEPAETRAYFAKLPTALAEKLDAVGLLLDHEKRDRQAKRLSLVEFFARTIEARPDWKPLTIGNYGQTQKKVAKFFGTEPIELVTPQRVVEFRAWLKGTEGLHENTVKGHLKNLRSILSAAVRGGLLDENPASRQKTLIGSNESRKRLIDELTSLKILANCPNARWRAIFSLARWGGVRIPSEIRSLEWQHIDWDTGRMRIFSSKTEADETAGWREVPLFPAVAEALREWHLEAEPGDRVFPDLGRSTNLRTQLLKILKKAGVEAWPKPFNNLRATRASELAAEFPGHVAARWLGHSPKTADVYYRQTSPADWEKALQPAQQSGGKMDPFGPSAPPNLKDLSPFVANRYTPLDSNQQPSVP
jgi:integrase